MPSWITLGAISKVISDRAATLPRPRTPGRRVDPCPNSQERLLMSSYVDSLWMMAAIVAALILGGRLARKFRVRWAGRLAGVGVVGLAITAAACVVGRGLPFFGRPAAALAADPQPGIPAAHRLVAGRGGRRTFGHVWGRPPAPRSSRATSARTSGCSWSFFAAAIGMPFVIARFLTRRSQMPDYSRGTVRPRLHGLPAQRGDHRLKSPPKLGIDLAGGVIFVYEVKPPEADRRPTNRGSRPARRVRLPDQGGHGQAGGRRQPPCEPRRYPRSDRPLPRLQRGRDHHPRGRTTRKSSR